MSDAAALLAAGRWSSAYYLAGYAVECGLKACIMARIETTGMIFEDKKFAEKCWTHDLRELLALAGLAAALGADAALNAAFALNWENTTDWTEASRYEQTTQAQAQTIFDAITNNPNGVLPWIRIRW